MNEEDISQEPTEDVAAGKPAMEADEDAGTAPARSRRPSFGGIRRQLTEAELASPAIQKLLLDMLEETEASRDEYKSYIEAYHAADKRAGILGEKLNRDRAVDVFFGVGVGLGGTILGLSPFLWEKGIVYGVISLIIGVAIIIGASIGRLVKQ